MQPPQETGRIGGQTAARNMTQAARLERARKAAITRWQSSGIPIPANLYEGAGKAWAALKDGEVVGIRYMQNYPSPTLESLGRKRMTPAARRDLEQAEAESFRAWRLKARAELEALGTVVSGTASGGAFWLRDEETIVRASLLAFPMVRLEGGE